MKRRAARRRALTDAEARDAVLVALSQVTGTVNLGTVAERSHVGPKQAAVALTALRQAGHVDHWPVIRGWRITTSGLEQAALVETNRQATAEPWAWRKAPRP